MLKSEVLRKQRESKHTEFHWKSFDKINLFAQSWVPAADPKALIVLVHDAGGHSGRFQKWAEELALKNFAIFAFDLRGYGLSEGGRGCTSNYSDLLKDIELFLEKCMEMCPNIPAFLYGTGFGGNLILNYAVSGTPKFKGLIVTSPWLELIQKPSPLKLFLISSIAHIMPKMLMETGLKAEDISRDLRAVHIFRNDKIGIKLYLQTYKAGIKALRSIYKINVPLLVMHGNADNFTSCRSTSDFVRNSSDKTKFIEWECAYHELHDDIEKEKVFDALTEWLKFHC